jgi:hypothetical protein
MTQAWAFCVHVIGFVDPTGAVGSLRCRGSAHRQFMSRKPQNRTDSILTCLVWILVFAACYEADALLRAVAGYACLCTHGRLRCADGNCIEALDHDAIIAADGEVT